MCLSSVNLTGRLRPWISNISTNLSSSLCLHSRAFHLVMTRSRQELDMFCEELQWCTTLFFLQSSLVFFLMLFLCVWGDIWNLTAENKSGFLLVSVLILKKKNESLNYKSLEMFKVFFFFFLQWQMKELCSEEVKKVHMLENSSRCFF